MNDAADIYSTIVDSNLNIKNKLARIQEEALRLRDEGYPEVAKELLGKALAGAAFFPHHKQELRDFAEVELLP